MRLMNDISERERALRNLCAICDEDSYARIDYDESHDNLRRPLYCRYCLDNWREKDVGKLQIGRH